jgi:hypothetical protein
MARFSDGAAHQARRDRVLALLPDAAEAERSARAMTTTALAGCEGTQEAMELARRVPVAVLAGALGVPSGRIGAVVTATGQLCAALAPAPGPAEVADGEHAAFALINIFAGREGDDHTVAVISVLFQACDATAALIGLALARAGAGPGEAAAGLVETVLRDDRWCHHPGGRGRLDPAGGRREQCGRDRGGRGNCAAHGNCGAHGNCAARGGGAGEACDVRQRPARVPRRRPGCGAGPRGRQRCAGGGLAAGGWG